jgi:hypothetical protein
VGAVINFILDGNDLNPIGFDGVPPFSGSSNHLFFGVIDTDGFTQFEVREIEGTIGDEELIWADDFTIAVPFAPAVPSLVGAGLVALAGALVLAAVPVLVGRRSLQRSSSAIRNAPTR